jgi:hypothetical protein
MNFIGHLIERCGLVCVHTSEILGWIEFAIYIVSPRSGYYPLLKMDHL